MVCKCSNALSRHLLIGRRLDRGRSGRTDGRRGKIRVRFSGYEKKKGWLRLSFFFSQFFENMVPFSVKYDIINLFKA